MSLNIFSRLSFIFASKSLFFFTLGLIFFFRFFVNWLVVKPLRSLLDTTSAISDNHQKLSCYSLLCCRKYRKQDISRKNIFLKFSIQFLHFRRNWFLKRKNKICCWKIQNFIKPYNSCWIFLLFVSSIGSFCFCFFLPITNYDIFSVTGEGENEGTESNNAANTKR